MPLTETRCKKGVGPRHLVFHPSLPYLYLNYERYGFISQYKYDKASCMLVNDFDIMPEISESLERFDQSEILIDSTGTHLYNIMRGLGLLYVFAINQNDGSLIKQQVIEMESKLARGAAFSPDGCFLLVACTDKENIVTYKVHTDGTLSEVGVSPQLAHPASIVFYE